MLSFALAPNSRASRAQTQTRDRHIGTPGTGQRQHQHGTSHPDYPDPIGWAADGECKQARERGGRGGADGAGREGSEYSRRPRSPGRRGKWLDKNKRGFAPGQRRGVGRTGREPSPHKTLALRVQVGLSPGPPAIARWLAVLAAGVRSSRSWEIVVDAPSAPSHLIRRTAINSSKTSCSLRIRCGHIRLSAQSKPDEANVE